MELDKWKNRYTVRAFDSNIIPPRETIDYLVDIVQYIPAQLGASDHIWCLLTPEDQDLKDWLVENIYCTDDDYMGHREFFTALRDAPYTFTSFQLNMPDDLGPYFENADQVRQIRRPKPNETMRNNAFHAGVLVSESLGAGLDVCQIVCTDGYNGSEGKLYPQYVEKMWNRFGKGLENIYMSFPLGRYYFKKELIAKPMMSVGVGKGLPHTENDYTPYKHGVTFTGQKFKKWFNNMVE
jgi:hypothetical protein